MCCFLIFASFSQLRCAQKIFYITIKKREFRLLWSRISFRWIFFFSLIFGAIQFVINNNRVENFSHFMLCFVCELRESCVALDEYFRAFTNLRNFRLAAVVFRRLSNSTKSVVFFYFAKNWCQMWPFKTQRRQRSSEKWKHENGIKKQMS